MNNSSEISAAVKTPNLYPRSVNVPDLGAALNSPDHFLVKRKLHRSVLFVPGADGEQGFYLKVFHPTRFIKKVSGAILPYAALKEYYIAKVLIKLGISTAIPVALGFCRGKDCFGVSLVLTREIPQARNLCELLNDRTTTSELRYELLADYAEILAQLNSAGFFVRDYYMDNVLFSAVGDSRKAYLIDHESTRPVFGWLRHWQGKNIVSGVYSEANSELSEEEVDHFLRRYLKKFYQKEPSDEDFQAWRSRIDSLHNQILLKRKRRNTRSPYKKAERVNNLRISRRRGLNGVFFEAVWNEVLTRFNSRDELLKTKNCNFDLMVNDTCLNVSLYQKPAVLGLLRSLLQCSPAAIAFRREKSKSANVIGMVESYPNGPGIVIKKHL